MELHFCDICNESVPQSDLDRGKAFVRHGRVVCARCELAMSHEDEPDGAQAPGGAAGAVREAPVHAIGTASPAPTRSTPIPQGPSAPGSSAPIFLPPPPARTGSGGLLLVGLMAASALVVSSIVTVVLVERIQDARGEAAVELARAERRTSQQVVELRSALSDWREEERAERARDHESLRAEEAGERSRVTARLDAVDARLDGLRRVSDRIDDLEKQLATDRADAGAAASDLAQLKRDVGILAERWMEALATGDVIAAAPEPGVVEKEPEWMEHTRGLASPSAATRWSAVTALGETKDPRVVPHLLAMLVDPDIFVRMATARILGDLRGSEAIGSLIDALEDEEPAVREAVVAALRAITGENFRFDPMANEAERARRVKAWRDWWKKSGKA